MLCYKDMTFCSNWKKCKNADTCHRAFTEEVEKKCDVWWKSFKSKDGAPVSMADFTECFESKMKSDCCHVDIEFIKSDPPLIGAIRFCSKCKRPCFEERS